MGQPQDPTSSGPDPTTAPASQVLARWVAKHGPVQGQAAIVDALIPDPDGDKLPKIPNPSPAYHYTFQDGSTLDMTWEGTIKNADEKTTPAPKAPAGTPVNDPRTGQPIAVTTPNGGTVNLPATPAPRNTQTTTVNGVTYERGADGVWHAAAGVPAEGKPKPSDPSKFQPVHQNPADPNSPVIALQDPSTGERVAVPQGPTRKSGTEDTIQGGTIYHIQYDADGNPHVAGSEAAPDPSKVPDGTQTIIPAAGGWGIPATYQHGQAIPTGATAIALTPEAQSKPVEGQTRGNVQSGYTVQEVYRGGQWVIDPTVPPKRFVPQDTAAVNAPSDQQYLTRYDPNTGQYTQTENLNYQAKDPAGRVVQLQAQAKAQRDQLTAQVLSGKLTQDQAAKQFDEWWNATIEPQKAQIAQAQALVQADEQRKQQEQSRLNEGTAQEAGKNAVAAVQATLPYRVGPGFQTAVNQIANSYKTGQFPGNVDIGSAVTFDMPDMNQIAQQATAQALAHISPTAAGVLGGQMPGMPQGVDINGALNESQYTPTTTIAPDGTVTIQHTAPPKPQPDFAAQSINDPSRGPQIPALGVYRPPQMAPPVGPMGGPLMG